MTTKADHKAALEFATALLGANGNTGNLATAYLERDRQLRELRELAKALTNRMDELSGELQGVFTFYHAHGMKWPADKNWKKEFDALRAALGEE